MFTGLVQDIGVVSSIRLEGGSAIFLIDTRLAEKVILGDSLAVNGVCLTVTAIHNNHISVTAIAETLDRSALGQIKIGTKVNLEPALKVGDRFGGHIVQGHVDGIGHITHLIKRGLSTEMIVTASPDILHYTVEKGSITIDGVSLTIARGDPNSFTVALIPHTLNNTCLKERTIGDLVNLEVDILAKYVEKMLSTYVSQSHSKLNEAWLHQQGF
jgi:riboflavin synthase